MGWGSDFMGFAKKVAESDEFKNFTKPQAAASAGSQDRATYAQQSQQAVPADVRMFSGCKDEQTSADVSNIDSFGLPETNGPAGAAGACTTSMMLALEHNPDLTWVQLLDEMRKILKTKGYSQIPELSASRDMDLEEKFSVVNRDAAASGKKKALLIGINYKGQKGELSGCINDVKRIHQYITSNGFEENDIRVLTDDTDEKPTAKNIMEGLVWLAADASPDDSLFLHYSGHGGRMKDDDGDEKDGYDETLIPIDYRESGQIRDDDVFKTLVAPLPKGCHLTCLMDCCHSGTILDLPFMLMGDDANMELFEAGEAMHMSPNPAFNMEFVLKIAMELYKAYSESGGDMQATGTAFLKTVAGGGAGGSSGGSGGSGGDALSGLAGNFF
mmetsp:Transcript_31115/g.87214  ORF Transcript_31115/g.87214 Transcript_31115/m.87214 type:complete len:386 (-) Transcript_31115:44-1201(-)|eukprot:CAMPEP_0119121220 /NCGR_PEP_ID=MMETSP1310-20130426/1956_1 /TAXON_ID=464262 /ORGANISM="Genus nov. species nov., Strain RCC2339" /LENGTH=385 /DNA_ID=CAMNT_0007110777 /DNA_START=159 /DNA_END=1316 /DNA_ORIENTATION=-